MGLFDKIGQVWTDAVDSVKKVLGIKKTEPAKQSEQAEQKSIFNTQNNNSSSDEVKISHVNERYRNVFGDKITEHLDNIRKYAKENNIPEELMVSFINQLSSFDENNITGLTEDTAKEMGLNPEDINNPELNIAAGCKYLKKMYDWCLEENQEKGTSFGWNEAMAAYKEGFGVISAEGGVPENAKGYIDEINGNIKKLTGKVTVENTTKIARNVDKDINNKKVAINTLQNINAELYAIDNSEDTKVQPETETNRGRKILGNDDYCAAFGFIEDNRFTDEQIGQIRGYMDIVREKAQKYGIPEELIMAQINQESKFGLYDYSDVGATGLMQLMPETARELGCDDLLNPEQNIEAGCKYMKQLYDMYGRWDLALAAYNGGMGNVDYYKGIPPFPETQEYVTNISEDYKKLTGRDLRKV